MTRSRFFSVASVTALLALGVVACGNADKSEAVEAEAQTEEEQVAETQIDGADDASSYVDQVQTYTEELDTTEDAMEDEGVSVADAVDAANGESADLLAETGERLDDAAATLAALKPMQVSDVRSKADIDLVTASAFDAADFNRDGVLDRDEFANMTMVVVNRDGDNLADKASGAAEKMLNNVTGAAGDEVTKPADATVTDAVIDEAFAQASGDDAAMTKEELRETFLARFEQADANDNDQLEEEERKKFALLSAGKIDQ